MLLTLTRRFLGAIPVLLALVAVVFTLQKIAPVDPVVALIGDKAPPEVYEAAREKLGLNDPLPMQLLSYLGKAVQGDLGISTVTRTPVAHDILEFLPVTLELVFVAGILIAVIGFFLGLSTAQGWRGSGVLRVVMISGASVPVFLACLPLARPMRTTPPAAQHISCSSTVCWRAGPGCSWTHWHTSSCLPCASPSHLRSPSAGCCAAAWRERCGPNTPAPPAPKA